MTFPSDSELFQDIGPDGTLQESELSTGTSSIAYLIALLFHDMDTRSHLGSRKSNKFHRDQEIHKFWVDGDKALEGCGTHIGSFPPEKWSVFTYQNEDLGTGIKSKKVECYVDYFKELDKSVKKREFAIENASGVSDYYVPIRDAYDEMKECTRAYKALHSSLLFWMLGLVLWQLFFVSPLLPGFPPIARQLTQALEGLVGAVPVLVLVHLPQIIALLVLMINIMIQAKVEDMGGWFIFLNPIAFIVAEVLMFVSCTFALQPEAWGDDTYDTMAFMCYIFLGIYAVWFLIMFFKVVYELHYAKKKAQGLPPLRRNYIKAVETYAPSIHRYIRLRSLWWQNLYPGRARPSCFGTLEYELEHILKEYEKAKAQEARSAHK